MGEIRSHIFLEDKCLLNSRILMLKPLKKDSGKKEMVTLQSSDRIL